MLVSTSHITSYASIEEGGSERFALLLMDSVNRFVQLLHVGVSGGRDNTQQTEDHLQREFEHPMNAITASHSRNGLSLKWLKGIMKCNGNNFMFHKLRWKLRNWRIYFMKYGFNSITHSLNGKRIPDPVDC